MSREAFLQNCTAAIFREDFPAIEDMRFHVQAEDVAPLAELYGRLFTWPTKSLLVELLGQRSEPAALAVFHTFVMKHPPPTDDGEWAALATSVAQLSGQPGRWGELFGDHATLAREISELKTRPAPGSGER